MVSAVDIADPAPAPAPRRAAPPRRLAILGATGSIGGSCARVIAAAPGRFAVVSVAGGRDGAALARRAIELGAEFAAIADPAGYADLKAALSGSGVEAAAGPDAVREAALREADLVVSAIVGAAGLEPTYAAVGGGTHRRARQQGDARVRGRGDHGDRGARRRASCCRWIPSTTPSFRRSGHAIRTRSR